MPAQGTSACPPRDRHIPVPDSGICQHGDPTQARAGNRRTPAQESRARPHIGTPRTPAREPGACPHGNPVHTRTGNTAHARTGNRCMPAQSNGPALRSVGPAAAQRVLRCGAPSCQARRPQGPLRGAPSCGRMVRPVGNPLSPLRPRLPGCRRRVAGWPSPPSPARGDDGWDSLTRQGWPCSPRPHRTGDRDRERSQRSWSHGRV